MPAAGPLSPFHMRRMSPLSHGYPTTAANMLFMVTILLRTVVEKIAIVSSKPPVVFLL